MIIKGTKRYRLVFHVFFQLKGQVSLGHSIFCRYIHILANRILPTINLGNFIDHTVYAFRSIAHFHKPSTSIHYHIPTMPGASVSPSRYKINTRWNTYRAQCKRQVKCHLLTRTPSAMHHFLKTLRIGIFPHSYIIPHTFLQGYADCYLFGSQGRVQQMPITFVPYFHPIGQRFIPHPIRKNVMTEVLK